MRSILVILLLLFGCAPYVPLHTPHASVATLNQYGITLHLEYLKTEAGHHIFDLEVVNESAREVEVVPSQIRIYSDSRRIVNPEGQGDPHRAPLPLKLRARSAEEVLVIYQQKEKNRQAAAIFFAVIGAAAVVYDAVEDNKDARKTTLTERDIKNAVAREAVVTATFTATDIALQSVNASAEENYFLPKELFSFTRIPAGGSQRGKVFVPSEASYRHLQLVVPIGRVEYVFDFKRRSSS